VIVLDASAVGHALTTATGAAVTQRLFGEQVPSPAHLDPEVGAALRRLVRRQLISDHDGLTALREFRDLTSSAGWSHR